MRLTVIIDFDMEASVEDAYKMITDILEARGLGWDVIDAQERQGEGEQVSHKKLNELADHYRLPNCPKCGKERLHQCESGDPGCLHCSHCGFMKQPGDTL